jgi:hypothetical protein
VGHDASPQDQSHADRSADSVTHSLPEKRIGLYHVAHVKIVFNGLINSRSLFNACPRGSGTEGWGGDELQNGGKQDQSV